jgi:hypothetical protein
VALHIAQHQKRYIKTANNNVKIYQFKHSVEDDQIIRQKLQISNLLSLEIVLHITWYSAFIDAE